MLLYNLDKVIPFEKKNEEKLSFQFLHINEDIIPCLNLNNGFVNEIVQHILNLQIKKSESLIFLVVDFREFPSTTIDKLIKALIDTKKVPLILCDEILKYQPKQYQDVLKKFNAYYDDRWHAIMNGDGLFDGEVLSSNGTLDSPIMAKMREELSKLSNPYLLTGHLL